MYRIHTFTKSTVAHTFVLFHPIETVIIARCPLIQSGSIKAGKPASWSWYSLRSQRQTLMSVLRHEMIELSVNGSQGTHKLSHIWSHSPPHGLNHRTRANHNK